MTTSDQNAETLPGKSIQRRREDAAYVLAEVSSDCAKMIGYLARSSPGPWEPNEDAIFGVMKKLECVRNLLKG